MPNGDLQIDFRDPEVADTVRIRFLTNVLLLIVILTYIGMSRSRKSIYCWCWQCTTIVDSRKQAMKRLHAIPTISPTHLLIVHLVVVSVRITCCCHHHMR